MVPQRAGRKTANRATAADQYLGFCNVRKTDRQEIWHACFLKANALAALPCVIMHEKDSLISFVFLPHIAHHAQDVPEEVVQSSVRRGEEEF